MLPDFDLLPVKMYQGHKKRSEDEDDSMENLPAVYINPWRTPKKATRVPGSSPLSLGGKTPRLTITIPPKILRVPAETSAIQQSPEVGLLCNLSVSRALTL